MKRATFVRNIPHHKGSDVQRLYRCDPPMAGRERSDEPTTPHQYVVTSRVDVPMSGPETYIFGADEHGAITDWCELDGSMRGEHSHEDVLREAGYEPEGRPS